MLTQKNKKGKSETAILAVDTTFNLCDIWITDISYRKKRIVNAENEENPVSFQTIRLHFTKHQKTFSRFALGILACNPNVKNLKAIGIDFESAIYTGFKRVIPTLCRLICVRNLMKRGKRKLAELLPNTGRNTADRKQSSSQILKVIYGTRFDNYYESGLVE